MAAVISRVATGSRERKKQQTRELIAQTARRLFLSAASTVPVAEIARAADVLRRRSQLLPAQGGPRLLAARVLRADLLAAVRDRSVGESVLDAFSRFVLQRRGLLAEPIPRPPSLAALTRMITEARPCPRARDLRALQ
jgi:hypothetical protein